MWLFLLTGVFGTVTRAADVSRLPSTRRKFWADKIQANRKRDRAGPPRSTKKGMDGGDSVGLPHWQSC